jgi:hypothetical protein
MYFWQTKKLAEQIKSGKVSQRLERNYYIACLIITIGFTYASRFSVSKNIMASMIELTLILLIIIGGIQLTFRANKGNGGEDYVKRMVLLSLPIVVRLIVGFLIFGSLINVVLILVDCSVLITSLWMPIVISVLFQIIFFWRLTVHLRFITS